MISQLQRVTKGVRSPSDLGHSAGLRRPKILRSPSKVSMTGHSPPAGRPARNHAGGGPGRQGVVSLCVRSHLRRRGVRVYGDLESLVPQGGSGESVDPDKVPSDVLRAAAVEVIAQLLIREANRVQSKGQRPLEDPRKRRGRWRRQAGTTEGGHHG